ncbi:flagellar biosynthesis protein FlhF [Aneurinibacillus soli]|uniref:Flagellar biosynthesis protein FlhF n=1 Tax=Aneurinibacillus soli TaxID=1500254 RepID=A0A0U5BBW7_9BACL|nr:flagellar biosynthesis protein FlhF [Aneurinibacillus soli]PYE63381.1 flagellar biosynthesis protein FlhF [Aneurinibacillus soli]BAU27687.1 Flagellar biosynthesis protein FlhF [Aneurinibacillus soli]
MRVKKYIVDSMSDALEQIRSELGKDAIILNTKPVKTGGFLGMFGKKQIEVIAAIDPNAEKPRPRRTEPTKTTPPPVPAVATPIEVVPVSKASFGKKDSETVDFSAVLYQKAVQENIPPAPEVNVQVLTKEIGDMRNMLWKLMLTDEKAAAMPSVFMTIRQRLQRQEVEDDIIVSLFERVMKQLSSEELSQETKVWAEVRKQLTAWMDESQLVPGPLNQDAAFVSFVGPTGVGKTTTLAKLAAASVLHHKRKVGMITSDTYRIAAVEQLKTYANILNVPLKVVYAAEELPQTIERLTGCDLIFMDTAGRNYRNKEYVEEVNRLLVSHQPIETFLVVSLTAKYEDIKAVAESFRHVPIQKVIFTKVDETRSYGAIVNLVLERGLSLSYFANGQNVPDDIEQATSERVVSLVLGDREHE